MFADHKGAAYSTTCGFTYTALWMTVYVFGTICGAVHIWHFFKIINCNPNLKESLPPLSCFWQCLSTATAIKLSQNHEAEVFVSRFLFLRSFLAISTDLGKRTPGVIRAESTRPGMCSFQTLCLKMGLQGVTNNFPSSLQQSLRAIVNMGDSHWAIS